MYNNIVYIGQKVGISDIYSWTFGKTEISVLYPVWFSIGLTFFYPVPSRDIANQRRIPRYFVKVHPYPPGSRIFTPCIFSKGMSVGHRVHTNCPLIFQKFLVKLRLHFTQISFENVTQEKLHNPSYSHRSPPSFLRNLTLILSNIYSPYSLSKSTFTRNLSDQVFGQK